MLNLHGCNNSLSLFLTSNIETKDRLTVNFYSQQHLVTPILNNNYIDNRYIFYPR